MCTIRIPMPKGLVFFFFNLKIKIMRNPLTVQWLGLCAFIAGGPRVPSLVGELRPHKPCGVTNNNKKEQKTKRNLKISN